MNESKSVMNRDRGGFDEYDEEAGINFAGLVLTLWRGRWVILAATVVCGLAALVLGERSSPVYEATVKLMVLPPKTTQAGELPPAVSVASFKALAENQTLAASMVKEFKLDAPPLSMTPQRFLRTALTVETLRDTNVILVTVRLADRELPARIANRLAQEVVALAERLSQDETIRSRDQIKIQQELSRARLEQSERKLETFRQEAQVEALRKDVDATLNERSKLLRLVVETEAEKARLAKAEQELAARKPIGVVKRTIDSDPALMEAGRETAKSGTSLLGLEVRNEYSNVVYEKLDQKVAESRTRLSGLEKEKAELIGLRRLNAARLPALNLLYEREAELAKLETEYELAKKIYLDVATRYEQVRLQVSGRSAQLQTLDPALPSDRPVGPKVLRNVVVASVMGLLLAVVAVLTFAALARVVSLGGTSGKGTSPTANTVQDV